MWICNVTSAYTDCTLSKYLGKASNQSILYRMFWLVFHRFWVIIIISVDAEVPHLVPQQKRSHCIDISIDILYTFGQFSLFAKRHHLIMTLAHCACLDGRSLRSSLYLKLTNCCLQVCLTNVSHHTNNYY